jgi:hypothetical protein
MEKLNKIKTIYRCKPAEIYLAEEADPILEEVKAFLVELAEEADISNTYKVGKSKQLLEKML